ncbi:DUF1990 domain-containing protein [Streptomyces sp. NPDC097619]|uniref:DUF1990 family protein n=1 Tax=Streptomyces sp. NPDC097619 TaxID=3157228 RepID=UPI003324A787
MEPTEPTPQDPTRRPAPETLSYPERGATRHRPLPAGYHHLGHRTAIGHGPEVFARAGAAVTGFAMHRAAGVRVRAADRAEPGGSVEISAGLGPVRLAVPCEVVWTDQDPARVGFAYGTRPGHPECGEESFVVELAPDGTVWFEVTAFSRPARWYTRLAGPVVPVLQHAYARHCGRVLRRLAAAS